MMDREQNLSFVDKKPQLPILLLFVSLANILGILYTAALPDLAKYFQIAKAQAQQTLSFYLMGCLFGQLLYAPLANAFGRKPAIYIGGCLALIGSILCLIAIETHLFSLLLIGRILTALGASCGLILTNTLIADAFTFAQSRKILAYLMSGFAVFPAVSITIGGFITEYLSWKGCFYFMFFYAAIVIALCILLPETAKRTGLEHLKIRTIARSYLAQLSNPRFLLYASIVAFASIILYIFSAEAPFIAVNRLHISADRFGLYNLIPNVGLLIGGLTSAHLSHHFSSKTLLTVSSFAFLVFSAIMWICFEWQWITTLTLFGGPLLIFLVTPYALSNGQVLSLAASEDKAYASSLMYVVQYLWMVLSINALRLFNPQNAAALPSLYTLSGSLMVLFLGIIWLSYHRRDL
jgi:MFS family permease